MSDLHRPEAIQKAVPAPPLNRNIERFLIFLNLRGFGELAGRLAHQLGSDPATAESVVRWTELVVESGFPIGLIIVLGHRWIVIEKGRPPADKPPLHPLSRALDRAGAEIGVALGLVVIAAYFTDNPGLIAALTSLCFGVALLAAAQGFSAKVKVPAWLLVLGAAIAVGMENEWSRPITAGFAMLAFLATFFSDPVRSELGT